MKYESELIKEIVDSRGHEKSSTHYQSECVETWIDETKGAYPKLCDYQTEWLNYIVENPLGEFPYETVTDVTDATINNVVPYAYKSAILKGSTKYRDIDTGEILETFEEGRNLELVSVKMPVLTTTGKNLFNDDLLVNKDIIINIDGVDVYKPIITSNYGTATTSDSGFRLKNNIFKDNTQYTLSFKFTENSSSALHKQIIYRYTDGETYQSWGEREGVVYYTTKANKTLETISVISKNTDGTNFGIYDVQLEEGSVLTDYEPYKSNILTVNEDIKLCSVGDIRDELDCLTGKVTKRISESVLNGSEDWILHVGKTHTKVFKLTVDDIKDISHQIICDCLPTNADGDVEKITNTFNDIYLALSTSKANTLAEFKAYLSNNPMIVQYPLKTKSDKTVDLNIQDQDGKTLSIIKPIEGTMHIHSEGTPLKPSITMEIPVEATTQNLASFIKEE